MDIYGTGERQMRLSKRGLPSSLRVGGAPLLAALLTSYKLQATSYKLHAASYKLHAASYTLHAASYTLQATSHKPRVTNTPRRAKDTFVQDLGSASLVTCNL